MPVCVNRGNPIPQISLFGRQSVDKNGKEKSQIADLQRFGIGHGDPGEARTLDPMIKSHLLYQLSYGVNVLLISVAKVMPFFYPTKFSGYFFQKKLS